MKAPLCVFDIDGVLVDTEPIILEIIDKGLTGEAKWNYFHDQCNRKDLKVNSDIVNLIKKIHEYGIPIKFLTGRSELTRNKTSELLDKTFNVKSGNEWWDLIMRPFDDRRGSDRVKSDVFKDLMKDFDIKLFVDDDIRNIKAAEKLGINSLHYENKGSRANEVF